MHVHCRAPGDGGALFLYRKCAHKPRVAPVVMPGPPLDMTDSWLQHYKSIVNPVSQQPFNEVGFGLIVSGFGLALALAL